MSPRERRRGLPRERTLHWTVDSPALVHDRLEAFAVAFLNDPRPWLLFDDGRLVFANDAARSLLGSTTASDSFLETLGVAVGTGAIEAVPSLRALTGVYAPVLHRARNRRGHPTRICFLVQRREAPSACEGLSDRELAVLRLLVKGLTNQEIADELGISIETVRKHVAHALEKTGTKTRAGLVGHALGR